MSFWIGGAASVLSLLAAAALAGLLPLLSPVAVDGAVVIIIFGILWFGLFFLGYPLQKRYARSLDLRRPGITLAHDLLTIPSAAGPALRFKLDEPHELAFGWYEVTARNQRGGLTRWYVTYATLSQARQRVCLEAEYSYREARAAGWTETLSPAVPADTLRLWPGDLVALVEAVRARV